MLRSIRYRIAPLAAIVLSGLLTGSCLLFGKLSGIAIDSGFYFFLFIALLITFYGLVALVVPRFFLPLLKSIYDKIIQVGFSGNLIRQYNVRNSRLIDEIFDVLDEWTKISGKRIEDMQKVEVYRREFLSNVSHELKTPLFAVQGYVLTLLDGGIDDPMVNSYYLKRAAKNIDRLISIVEDLESISRIESGELILEKRIFDIRELVKDTIESLELLAAEKKIHLEMSDSPIEQIYVSADKDMIRQVLVNFLVNSIKYGRENGSTSVSISETADKVIVDISDNGIGIEEQHLPRLFERFYRVDKGRSRDEGGTGLGLSIVKHIIEAHDEAVSVDSKPGVGTTFRFTLPRSK